MPATPTKPDTQQRIVRALAHCGLLSDGYTPDDLNDIAEVVMDELAAVSGSDRAEQ